MIEPLEQLFLAYRKTLYSLDHYADLALWWRPGDAREWLNLIRDASLSEPSEAPVDDEASAPASG